MVTTISDPVNLQELYTAQLEPRLAALEEERNKLRFAIIASALLIGLPAVGFWGSDIVGLALPEAFRSWVAPLCLVLIFVGAGVALSRYAAPGFTAYVNYRARFKRDIVAEIFKAICPGSTYEPDRYITEAIFDACGLFEKRGSFRGDDLVRGRIGQTPFEASELKREYATDSGNNRQTHVVFHGLFFHLDFNKTIRGRTMVQPQAVAGGVPAWGNDLMRIALEDPEFEKEFEVYSTNAVEARYILTPSLMERIVAIRQKTGKPIFAAFAGNSAFMAVHYGSALFEPSLAATTSFAALQEMADHFRLADLIVQELDLNTRIWTKDVDASLLDAAPAVSPLEGLNTGDLTEGALMGRAMQMAGKAYEDSNQGTPPKQPDNSRARLEKDDDGLSVRYGLRWWYFPFLLIALACALVALGAIAGLASSDLIRMVLATWVTPEPSDEFVSAIRTGCATALIGAIVIGGLPALAILGYVRRVHIGRGEVRVTRGFRVVPRRYPRTDQSRILQLEECVFLGRANELKLVNITLSPALRSSLEARWVAWEMRRAMDETR